MSKITELISGHTQYMMIAIYVIIAAIVITFVVNFAAKKLKFIKYLPGITLVFIGMFSLFSVINKLFDPSSLDNLIVFVICVAAGIISLLFALIIGILSNDLG
ncbi:cytochrome C biosynthesis protein [Peptoniphilus stercorisuis]|uniref:Chromate transport protein ChrA n=1 Tax=Peptoniphilus stercorisuis TaxID=1436965 RepID=A0ABS4KB28_9FIRM|nr:cytochrome C biosynthesis protein [Peptoniphilus stercorisuis]MBP2024972.1 chromate transport protein ChrA [Peptoniphilus stercorisuis]